MSITLRALALYDVAVRYANTFAYHWRNRHSGHRKSYTADEADFLPASLALIEKPVSPTARITGLSLVLLTASVVVWALIAHVDIIVTASGKVIPSGRTKTIASVDVASVRAIHVVEGQRVRAGDLLIELDARMFEADERKAQAEVDAARLEVARSEALIEALDKDRPPTLKPVSGTSFEDYEQAVYHVRGQYLDYKAKLAELEGEIHRYGLALPLAQERADGYGELVKTHDVSANAWSEKRQAVIDLDGQLIQAQNSRTSLIAQTRRQALDSLTDAETTASRALQDVARARSQVRLLTLRAPVDGSVQQLTVHTVGGVVAAAQPLMLIVPRDDTIEVEGFIENKDIGYVREGQSAAVKIDAFDYTKYGMVHGRVVLVSKDAVDDEKRGPVYKTHVRLDSPSLLVDGHPVLLSPGMTVHAEIRTGTRRVIEYVLSPLLRHRHESLNER
jgi:membrane fusion protein, hemolysin D